MWVDGRRSWAPVFLKAMAGTIVYIPEIAGMWNQLTRRRASPTTQAHADGQDGPRRQGNDLEVLHDRSQMDQGSQGGGPMVRALAQGGGNELPAYYGAQIHGESIQAIRDEQNVPGWPL